MMAASTAVFAVVAASLVFAAGAASADDVGVDHSKTICHVVSGQGNTGMGYDKITINENAWSAHQAHGDVAYSERSGCPKRAYDVSYPDNWTETFCFKGETVRMDFDVTGWGWDEKMAKDDAAALIKAEQAKYDGHVNGECPKPDPCKPTVDPTTNTLHICKVTFPTEWTDTFCYAGRTVEFSKEIVGVGFGSTYEQALANAKDNADFLLKVADKVMPKILDREYPGRTDGACSATADASWVTTICYAGITTEIDFTTETFSATGETTEAAQLAAQAKADEALAIWQEENYPIGFPDQYVEGACPILTQEFTATRTDSGTSAFCTTDGRDISFDYSGTATRTSAISQADADALAQASAVAAGQQNLTGLLAPFPEAIPGTCPVIPAAVPVAPVEPAVVAPVEAATVAVPEAATVAAPAAATVPEAVPAGDGSSAPQTPVWMLALLAVATVALGATAVRIATRSHS